MGARYIWCKPESRTRYHRKQEAPTPVKFNMHKASLVSQEGDECQRKAEIIGSRLDFDPQLFHQVVVHLVLFRRHKIVICLSNF